MRDWKSIRTLAIVAVAFAGLGCAAAFDRPRAPGVLGHTVQVAGDVTKSLEGDVVHGRTRDATYGDVFVVALQVPGTDGIIALARRNVARPAVGSYPISDVTANDIEELPQDEFFAWYVTGSGEASDALFLGTAGRLTVTQSSAESITARFELDAVGFETGDPTGELAVRLSGTFVSRAVAGQVRANVAAALVGRGF